MSDNLRVLIVGAGTIAKEYIKVLLAQHKVPIVITRGEDKASDLKRIYPDIEVLTGGLENRLNNFKMPTYAIVATPIESLSLCTKLLIQAGCKNIMAEKPLTFYSDDASVIKQMACIHNSNVFIAYNRRTYQSVLKAKELIVEDGGVLSFHFDFTEAIFKITPANYDENTLKYWGMANSSHVIDTAFYIAGKPAWIECRQYGDKVSWHEAGSVFTGMGETLAGVPFTYHANWGAPGRWNIEIMTEKRKLMLSPMEKLKQQKKNGFIVEDIEINERLDTDFKPGFHQQVSNFLSSGDLLSINKLEEGISIFKKVFNY
ncbi:MAG TPA: Gfo/Idh/MocA family oxidoreductase [Desulfobacteraceae bacterium]|nr:Gfo/Idh/MocA family oxidoreductase [Desulfobacteraceae bacterium]HPQ27842.1 Gfo/Idh/MocA family oxidoreductase [Desulfobacteraceae bacterium]